MPTGGERDTIPPKAVASYPGVNETGFKDNKIAIKFNEFVEWNNPNQNVIISPFIDGEILTKIHGKTVFIQPRNGFLPDKTYTIQLNNAIKDFNEGNMLPSYSHKFSTGNQLDSSNVRIQLKNIEKEDATDALIAFCKDKNSFFEKRYEYISMASKGQALFDNLDAKSYYLFAFLDSNFNKKWDENERIAFSDARISRKDTLNQLLLFPQTIEKNTAIADNFQFGSFDLNFVQSVKNLEIISPRIQSVFIHSKKYKILFPPLENSGKLIFKVDGIQDTIEYKANEKKVDFEWVGYDRSRETEKMRFDSVEIQWNAKISKVDANKITLKKDTTTIKLNGFIEGDKWILTNLEPNSNYTLIIDSGAMFASKYVCKKIEYAITTVEKNQFRETLNIKVDGDTKNALVEVFVNKKRMFFDVSQNPLISLKNVTNSTLSFVFFYDINKNGKWDSGRCAKSHSTRKINSQRIET
jgi:hypothetical protein